MTVAEIFRTLEYGPAPESAAPIDAWLDAHDRRLSLYIGGAWHDPADGERFDTVNPATGSTIASIAQGGAADVDAAVGAERLPAG